jgi:hypothetical protein
MIRINSPSDFPGAKTDWEKTGEWIIRKRIARA